MTVDFFFLSLKKLAFTRDGLCGLWNEMVKDGEIVYTGSEISQSGEASPRKGGSPFSPQLKLEREMELCSSLTSPPHSAAKVQLFLQ